MIASIILRNFRNHEQTEVAFSPSTNLIYGPNGAGKTSILEAIYSLYRGSSFKGSDRDLVRNGTEWFLAELHDHEGARRVTYDARGARPVKKFVIDDKEYARLPPRLKRPVVLFSPDDLQLLTGSPARRRRYIDAMITQIKPQYSVVLRKYERALLQRNKLLKSPSCAPDALFSWNVLLSEYGATIVNERVAAIEQLNAMVTGCYQAIAHTGDEIRITYTHDPTTPQALLRLLDERYGRDSLLGVTTTGPHRHDVEIGMNNTLAVATASRGENRTIILALKQLEAEYVSRQTHCAPIVLLDDVYGELDVARQKSLISLFSDCQIIITAIMEESADTVICL